MIDWLQSTLAERKALYKILKSIADAQAMSISTLCEGLFDTPLERSFESNAVAGRMKRTRCGKLYRWIAAHHPDRAHDLDAEIMRLRGGYTGWDAFVGAHAVRDSIELVRHETHSLTIVAFADADVLNAPQLRRGAFFSFRLASAFDGHAVAFQSVRDLWFALPLTLQSPILAISEGWQDMPVDGSGDIAPLVEESDMGLHRFVFVVAQERAALDGVRVLQAGKPVAGPVLHALADRLAALPSDTWRLHRLSVRFTD